MVFVDASAFVAILCDEPGGQEKAETISASPESITSPVAVFESVLGIRRQFEISVGDALHAMLLFVRRANIAIVPIDADAYLQALGAFERFGKGMGAKAKLNMGDCFAYAVAKQHGASILYTGNDFSHTDMA